MTFGKPRFNKKYEYELIRYCTINNFKILGGAGKLLKHFERTYNPNSVISYSNNDFSIGAMYNILEFKFSHYTAPNYFWWKKDMVLSRYQTQKHKLSGILENYNESISEKANMINNDWNQYHNCGNMVWYKYYK